jgi:hypothetical protein
MCTVGIPGYVNQIVSKQTHLTIYRIQTKKMRYTLLYFLFVLDLVLANDCSASSRVGTFEPSSHDIRIHTTETKLLSIEVSCKPMFPNDDVKADKTSDIL